MARQRAVVAEAESVRGFPGTAGTDETCVRFVLRHLPPPPCRVLEFSVQPGGLGDILARLGYRVSTIASTIVGGGTLPLWLREYARQPGGFDAVLINDTAEHFDEEELLSGVRKALTGSGCLIVVHRVRASARVKSGTMFAFAGFTRDAVSGHGFMPMDAVELAAPESDTGDARASTHPSSRGFVLKQAKA